MKGIEKKKIIFKAAIKVIVDQGLSNFSINKVCEEANVSKGGFIYHFPSKDQLLIELNYYIIGYAKELFDEEKKKCNTVTEAYINSCLKGYDSDEMKVYMALPNYHTELKYDETLQTFYEQINEQLEKELNEEWISVVLLFTDGFWLKHEAPHRELNQLKATSKFLLNQIFKYNK